MNPFDYFDRIFCINLDHRKDRWERSLQEFRKAGIENRVERFPAIFIQDNPAYGNHLSHAECLKMAKESSCSNVLIFEDDIEWLDDPYHIIYPLYDLKQTSWDMFYLGVNTELPHQQIAPHLSKLEMAYSTHAYAVKSNLFDDLIDINVDKNTLHNDVSYSKRIIPYHNCYASIPLLAGQYEGYSDIQKEYVKYNTFIVERFNKNLIPSNAGKDPLVTFIIPTMNRKTLKASLNSLILQTNPNWRAVVIFDGLEINPVIQDPRIIYLSCDKKKHAGLVRNEGFPWVASEFIAFLDDDDWVSPSYVSDIYHYKDYELIIFTYRDVVNNNIQPPIGYRKLEFGHVGISFVVKTKFVLEHDIEFRKKDCEDWVFIEECLQHGIKYRMTDKINYFVNGRGEWR